MPRARIVSLLRAFIAASTVLALGAVDAGVALAADTPSVGVQPSEPVRYQVKKGDSLSLIARRNGVSVADLASANGISNVHLIVIGQWLVIPGPGTAVRPAEPVAAAPIAAPLLVPGPASPTPPPDAVTPLVYVLRRGDSISRVARRFKVTVAAIVSANQIKNPNRVPVGLRVVIPGTAMPATGAPIAAVPTTAPTPVAAPVTDPIAVAASVAPASTMVTTATTAAPAVPPGVSVATTLGLTTDQIARLPEALLAYPDRLVLMPVFDRWAAEYGVSPSLLKALAWMESGWQAAVVSSAGAIGIGQLLPATAKFVADVLIGTPLDPYVPEENIRMSARFLAHLLTLTNGDVNMALAGYYQGLTSVRRDGTSAATAAYAAVVLALQARF